MGGGAAGMTAALHLSPLVSAGLVAGPVDVYEMSTTPPSMAPSPPSNNNNNNEDYSSSVVAGGRQYHPGSGANGRDIGVGVWSTAWRPFLRCIEEGMGMTNTNGSTNEVMDALIQRAKDRVSYRNLLRDLEHCGTYVKDVGYRTPDGSWLVESTLNASPYSIDDLLQSSSPALDKKDAALDMMTTVESKRKTMKRLTCRHDRNNDDDPALLFVRERDLLTCLHDAIDIECRLGTVEYHRGVTVVGITDVEGQFGSLVLKSSSSLTRTTTAATSMATDEEGKYGEPITPSSTSSPRYNLIIAADGLSSLLRSRFAGYAISSIFSPRSRPNEWERHDTERHRVATMVEDRGYVVFRGNAPGGLSLTSTVNSGVEEDDDVSGGRHGGSFQTWGEDRAMRFAAVPFKSDKENVEEVVWFATISDPVFATTNHDNDDTQPLDAKRRKELLLSAFNSWHEPVRTLIETTPAEEIMYENAIAHRFTANPVFDVARILEFESWQEEQKRMKSKVDGSGCGGGSNSDRNIHGDGPTLVFIGDAMMSIDPVLAQGITIAMESAASVVHSIERAFVVRSKDYDDDAAVSSSSYQPNLLRKELTARSVRRERRLLHLLRSTELVQRLAQPSGVGSILSTWIVRPIVKLCPDVVKRKVFDYMIRYSLGLTGGGDQSR